MENLVQRVQNESELTAPDVGTGSEAPATSDPWWSRTWVVVAGLTTVVAVVPLAVAVGALRNPRWYPVLDLAQTELRVRDVGTGDRPLIGLAGRFDIDGPGPGGYEGWQGSHPGPLSFYALWPLYMLFGATAWALQIAAAALNIAAAGLSIWIGKRRAGVLLAMGIAAGLVLLMRAYGADKLTEAWNPYMPMMWWVVFLLAVWSVLCDDLPMLPIAVFAGSLCMQTHIPYLGMVGGLGGFTVLAVALLAGVSWRRRRTGAEPPDQPETFPPGRLLPWGGASGALLAILWAPPLYEQITRSPGNMSVVAESLRSTEETSPSAGKTLSIWLGHLDIRGLLDPSFVTTEAHEGVGPGLVLLIAWAAAAAFTALTWWRRQRATTPGSDPTRQSPSYDPRLARLHVVVGVALVLGVVSISRITGFLYYYLVLWAWGTTMLLLVALGWTIARRLSLQIRSSGADVRKSVTAAAAPGVTASAPPESSFPRASTVGVAGLAAVLLVTAAAFTWDASSTTTPAARDAEMLDVVAPATIEALRSGDLPGGGEDGRYLMQWDWLTGSDEQGLGGQAYGMFLELERQGFDVVAEPQHAAGIVPHRVWDTDDDPTASIHYVVGPCIIERWRNTPDATLVAEHDLRTPAEVERFNEVRDELVAELEAAGVGHLTERLDRSLFGLAVAPDFPDRLEPLVSELIDLSLPAAVFITPPFATPTADC